LEYELTKEGRFQVLSAANMMLTAFWDKATWYRSWPTFKWCVLLQSLGRWMPW